MLYIDNEYHIPKEMSLRTYLGNFLKENDISADSASHLFKMSRSSLEKYLSGDSWQWKLFHARILSDFLGVSVDEIIDASERDNTNEETTTESVKDCSFVLSHFDIKTLKELKIIPPRSTIESFAGYLASFFNLRNIRDYDNILTFNPLFSKSIRKIDEEKNKRMVDMWLKVGYLSAKSIISPFEYRSDILEVLLKSKFRYYTLDIKYGYQKIVMALYKIGITVITQPYLKCTGVFGTTMIIDSKPCIFISDNGKRYHKLWLTLLHEIYHVLNDYEMICSSGGYHCSSEDGDLFVDEDAADKFAMKVLMPEAYIKNIGPSINVDYIVQRTASELNVHPSIVYGVCHEWYYKTEKKDILKNHSVLISSHDAIKDICFDPIKYHSINDAVNNIKNILYKVSI